MIHRVLRAVGALLRQRVAIGWSDVVIAAGLVSVVRGWLLVWIPGAWFFAGAILVLLGLLLARADAAKEKSS